MSHETPSIRIEIVDSFLKIEESAWNALVAHDFIFADHRFLRALEESGSLGKRTGWHPQILLAWAEGSPEQLVGAIPLFVKTNSYGEYIFDWGWANAAEQAGLSYYPKLVSAIPFTPATGPKILLSQDALMAAKARERLIEKSLELANEVSSLHFLFTEKNETELLRERGFLVRHSFQYHWRNRGWSNFDEYLNAFRSKRRSEIRRERSHVANSPIRIRCLTGAELTASEKAPHEHADTMFSFYRSTTEKMGGHSYLTRDFFRRVFSTLADSILFVLATDENDVPVAGALNFFKDTTLFGRYWGCLEDHKNLHFEVCYYQAIEWALARGFQLFEAGAQGEHKFNRGFTPELTLSCHELRHVGLREAVADFLEREKESIDDLFKEYREHDPFKRPS